MGFLDKMKVKAADAVDKHGDKISGGLDKAAGMVDKRTNGKYSDKIEMGKAKAKERLEKRNGTGTGTGTDGLTPS